MALEQGQLVGRALDLWSKGCEFESWQEWWENFFLQSYLFVLTLIQCLFHIHVTAVEGKRPRSFCQKCRGQVTAKDTCTLDPVKSEWVDYTAVQELCGSLSGNVLSYNSLVNTKPQLTQLADPLWTDPGQKSEISVSELISTLKKRGGAGAGGE